jgi:hypothetical protein
MRDPEAVAKSYKASCARSALSGQHGACGQSLLLAQEIPVTPHRDVQGQHAKATSTGRSSCFVPDRQGTDGLKLQGHHMLVADVGLRSSAWV